MRIRRPFFLPILCVLVAIPAGSIGAFRLVQDQLPAFRSRVEVVQLDVSVLDGRRLPVRDLGPGDFTVLENGKPRKILGVATFDSSAEDSVSAPWTREIAPDVTSNDLKPGSRLFVVVVDDALIPQDPSFIGNAKKIVTAVIDQTSVEDLTAVVFTSDSRKTQDFTNDKAKLLAVLDQFNPGLASYRFGSDAPPLAVAGPGVQPPADGDLPFFQSSVRVLENVAAFLAAVPDRRKAVFWVSPGVPLDLSGAVPKDRNGKPLLPESALICLDGGVESCRTSPSAVWALRLPHADMQDLARRTERVFASAQRSNVAIYPIDPTGLDGSRHYLSLRLGTANAGIAKLKASAQEDYLMAAAANTGGRAVVATNEFDKGIRSIFSEASFYYLISFEPADLVPDGKLRRIEVKVNRPGVEVRTRSGYYAPQPDVRTTDQDSRGIQKGTPPEQVELAKAIGGMLPVTELPLRVAVAPFAVPGQRLSTVTVVLGVKQPIPLSAKDGRIIETTELQTTAFTPEGEPRGTQRHTAKVTLRAGSDGEASYEVLGRIDLPAGRYRLRLAAHNATSRKSGSVFTDVVVPDYSNNAVSASPLILGATPGRVSAPKDLFVPLLPFVPTSERDFSRDENVTALLRIYQSGQTSIAGAQATIRVYDDRASVRFTEVQSIGSDRFVVAGQQQLMARAETTKPAPAATRVTPVIPGKPVQLPADATEDKFANLSLGFADLRYSVPLSRLLPGQHLLSVEVEVSGSVLTRTVRFSVR